MKRTLFASQHGLTLCTYCYRLRPEKEFSYEMMCKSGPWSYASRDRFCVDCGISRRGHGYGPRTEVRVEGERWVWCRVCDVVRREERVGEGKVCTGCMGRRALGGGGEVKS